METGSSEDTYEDIIKSLYVNSFLWKLGSEEAECYKPLRTVVTNYVVNEYIERIKDNVGKEFSQCSVKSVGSFQEGTQVGIPREFDFILELADVTSLVKEDHLRSGFQIVPTIIPVTGPQQNPNIKPRTYVYLKICNPHEASTFASKLPSPWGELGQDQDQDILDSGKLQVRFKQCIEDTLKVHPNTTSRPYQIKLRGPAVCVYFGIKTSDIVNKAKNSCPRASLQMLKALGDELCLKIDFVLGIPFTVLEGTPLTIGNEGGTWEFQDATLTENAKDLQKCHLVVSGTYFRISISLFEATTVRDHISPESPSGEIKGVCLRAIKCLRDTLNPCSDPDGPVLATYPLKVSFLTECLDQENSWEKSHLAERVVSILSRVYEEGKAEILSSPFIQNESIFTREDKGYKEAKRMLNELSKYDKSHIKSVAKNWCVTVIIWLLFVAQYISHVLLKAYNILEMPGGWDTEVIINFSIVFALTCLFCIGVPCCCKLKLNKARYLVFRNIFLFRIILLLISLLLFCISLFTGSCVRYSMDTPRTFFCDLQVFPYLYEVILLMTICSGFLYIMVMLLIILGAHLKTSVPGCLKTWFNRFTCKNNAHEIIMCDCYLFTGFDIKSLYSTKDQEEERERLVREGRIQEALNV